VKSVALQQVMVEIAGDFIELIIVIYMLADDIRPYDVKSKIIL